MQMPVPAGTPMPLSTQVAGSLSRAQGLLQAAETEIQNAYAMHWLALRQAGGIPAFQDLTQHMLWGLYGTTALSGLLRHALSGRATPEVMAGVIDQSNLIRHSYTQAVNTLGEFLQTPEAREFTAVPPMVQAFRPLDQVYQSLQPPMQTVMTGIAWAPAAPVAMIPIRQALLPAPGPDAGQAPNGGPS